MTLAFTGHRPNKLENDYALCGHLVSNIERRITLDIVKMSNVDHIITGMALGVDMLAGYIADNMKIPFTAAIPCKNQECKWSKDNQAMYRYLLRRAHRVHYVSEGEYNVFAMMNRNKWMVDNCDEVYAVWDGTKGGTSNCVDYAKKKGKIIHFLNPLDYYGN